MLITAGDAAALRNNAVVAEAREVEHVGEVGQYFVPNERCARMCAAPGKIIGRGYLEVGIQIPREACKMAFDACLIEGVDHGFVSFSLGLAGHTDLLVSRDAIGRC